MSPLNAHDPLGRRASSASVLAISAPAVGVPPPPAGAPPWPRTQVADVTALLAASVAEGTAVGLPPSHHPERPLDDELAVASFHRADQYLLGQWLSDYQASAEGLRDSARQLVDDALVARQFAEDVVTERSKLVQQLRDQLSTPKDRFAGPVNPRWSRVLVTVVVMLLVGETIVFGPVVDAAFDVPRPIAYITAVFWALIATAAAYLTGHQTRQSLHYEGPARIRRGHISLAVVGGVAAGASVAGGALLRSQALAADYTGWLSLPGLVFLQAAPLILAGAHGFISSDPRIAELRGSEAALTMAEEEQAQAADAHGRSIEHQARLEHYDPEQAVRAGSRQLREQYRATIDVSRADRWRALAAAEQHASATRLLLLPLPDFAIPDDILPVPNDDFIDWVHGAVLHL